MTNRPLHREANRWISQGIFDDLSSFEEFEQRVNPIPLEKDRGDIFEIFIEGYLATQPITQHAQHWVVGDIPLELRERFNLPRDGTGIDGIYKEGTGNYVAYQVKYRQNHRLTFGEVSPFLGITEEFSDRVIFTNATTLAKKAEVRSRWFGGDIFNSLTPTDFKAIEEWLRQKPASKPKATPDPNYQTQVLADIKATLNDNARATVVMACGTGKTLVSLWATEQEKPKTVLVLLPSLLLLDATLKEWSQHTSWGEKFSYLCVCSDKKVGLKDDALQIDPSSVGFKVDTDPEVVRQFLEQPSDSVKVIFSTYQSSQVVAEGCKGLPPIDFAIFDEAHKTTGRAAKTFSYALDDENIQITKRLFLTATPRHIDIRKRDKDGEFQVRSMDDEKVYGPRAHTLSFGAAASKGIICDYKVLISLINKEMVDDFARKNGITLVEGDEIGANWVANLIALEQAVKKVGVTKIITFHSRVSNAEAFASDDPRGINQYLPDFRVGHVNGSQNTADRNALIKAFADAPKGAITNARCLTEGVNIPAVDMVAFIEPRQSKVDIVQAVGRAMRKPRGKTTKTLGYVLVPLFAGTDEKGFDEAIKSEKFDAIADVLNALREHDEDLVDIIRELKQAKGEGKRINPERLGEKIEFIGPTVALETLSQSITLQAVDTLGAAWDERFGALQSFWKREGHCRVLKNHWENGINLGSWVPYLRSRKEHLSAEQHERLDAIGFIWDVSSEQWERGFNALEVFRQREGHCKVPAVYLENGFKLGSWVSIQRRTKDELAPQRIERLSAIGFNWDVLDEQWEEGFNWLKTFYQREEHCRVPNAHLENEFKLGSWVGTQRRAKDRLTPERIARLGALGFIWDAVNEQWERGFRALEAFYRREGHCEVPLRHCEDDFLLGNWVGIQRKTKDKLTSERIARLDAIGFVWSVLDKNWEEAFRALENFYHREGHCIVLHTHVENGIKLGRWVSDQRIRKTQLTPDRLKRLEALGFVWDVNSQKWEEGFNALKAFQEREGHCKVHKDHRENGFKLGSWVIFQRDRLRKAHITPEQRKRLDSIGFVWDVYTEQWEEGFNWLKTFYQREGHCKVHKDHRENGFKLGGWVLSQRKARKEHVLTTERRARLDALGFIWDARQPKA